MVQGQDYVIEKEHTKNPKVNRKRTVSQDRDPLF